MQERRLVIDGIGVADLSNNLAINQRTTIRQRTTVEQHVRVATRLCTDESTCVARIGINPERLSNSRRSISGNRLHRARPDS
jgi:hypothetical protein